MYQPPAGLVAAPNLPCHHAIDRSRVIPSASESLGALALHRHPKLLWLLLHRQIYVRLMSLQGPPNGLSCAVCAVFVNRGAERGWLNASGKPKGGNGLPHIFRPQAA